MDSQSYCWSLKGLKANALNEDFNSWMNCSDSEYSSNVNMSSSELSSILDINNSSDTNSALVFYTWHFQLYLFHVRGQK